MKPKQAKVEITARKGIIEKFYKMAARGLDIKHHVPDLCGHFEQIIDYFYIQEEKTTGLLAAE